MQPSFDTWTSIFLLAAAMGVFLFIIVMTTSIKKNYPIAYLILAFSIILFQYVLYWTRYEEKIPYLSLLPPLCYYVTGPLLYLYFLNLYKKKVSFNYVLHFFPAFIILIPNFVILLKVLGLYEMTAKIPFVYLAQQHWYIVIHMIIYIVAISWLIFKNRASESEYEKVRANWSKVLILLYALFVLSYISYYVLVNFSFFNSQWDYMISAMMSLSIYTIGYFIVKQPSIFDGELHANLFLPIKNKNETLENSLLNEFYLNIIKHMESKKPYRDNELRLVNLADQLGFSTHLLSQIINNKSGNNFNHFINEYRLKEAEELLISTENTQIKSIYFDVGFNNKATFYKAFKMKHHCTPSEFKEKLKN
nr:transcriptional regulator, AraC family [uncultured bacterium]